MGQTKIANITKEIGQREFYVIYFFFYSLINSTISDSHNFLRAIERKTFDLSYSISPTQIMDHKSDLACYLTSTYSHMLMCKC